MTVVDGEAGAEEGEEEEEDHNSDGGGGGKRRDRRRSVSIVREVRRKKVKSGRRIESVNDGGREFVTVNSMVVGDGVRIWRRGGLVKNFMVTGVLGSRQSERSGGRGAL